MGVKTFPSRGMSQTRETRHVQISLSSPHRPFIETKLHKLGRPEISNVIITMSTLTCWQVWLLY